jgi:hypothetical protein
MNVGFIGLGRMGPDHEGFLRFSRNALAPRLEAGR